MAADSKIVIDLELRKQQAEDRLRQFEQKAAQQLERLQKVQARYAASPSAFTRNQLMASRLAYGRRLGDMQGEGARIRNLQLKIDEETARKGGKLFGLAVNKQTELFVKQFVGAYVMREAMNIGFAAMYTPGGNNAALRKAQGAAEGGTTGLQVGAAFGPWGAAIGAAVGALAGFTSALVKESKAIDAERAQRTNDITLRRIGTGRAIQNVAFERAVSMHARPAQISMLNRRIKELDEGAGQYSIKSLRQRLYRMERSGDHESNTYQAIKQMLQRSLAEKAQLQQQLFQTATKPYHQFRDVSQYADSKAKQGLYSGRAGTQYMMTPKGERRAIPINGVDFKNLNNPVVNELKSIRRNLEKIADRADRNIDESNAQGKWTRKHIVFGD